MPDNLPAVPGVQVLDINPNAFPPGTMVDGTLLDNTNTTPALTHVNAKPVWRSNQFNGPRPGIKVDQGVSGFYVPRPVSDDFTIYLLAKALLGAGSSVNFYSNGSLIDCEVSGAANDFGLTLRADRKLVGGVGNPDTSGTSAAGIATGITNVAIAIRRTKATGKFEVFVDGVKVIDITGNTNSLTAPVNMYVGWGASAGKVGGMFARIAAYDAAHVDADVVTVSNALHTMYDLPAAQYMLDAQGYAVIGPVAERIAKMQGYAVTGQLDLRAYKVINYGVLAPTDQRIFKLISYGVLSRLVEPPTEPVEEIIDCPPDEEIQDCCVPALNKLYELRVGPLNTLEDIRKGIWLTQDRINVLIREWNKLAAISQEQPPVV